MVLGSRDIGGDGSAHVGFHLVVYVVVVVIIIVAVHGGEESSREEIWIAQ